MIIIAQKKSLLLFVGAVDSGGRSLDNHPLIDAKSMQKIAQAVGGEEPKFGVEETPPFGAKPLWREYVSTPRLSSHEVEDCETYERFLENSAIGEKFVDESFPTTISSIHGHADGKIRNSGLTNFSDFVEENQVQWLRIPDIVENVSYVRFTCSIVT